MEITEDPFSFNEMLQDVVTIIEFRMRGKNIVLRLEVDPKVPSVLLGDETRVRQILINILGNAVKFTNSGSIELKCECRESDDEYEICFDVFHTNKCFYVFCPYRA